MRQEVGFQLLSSMCSRSAGWRDGWVVSIRIRDKEQDLTFRNRRLLVSSRNSDPGINKAKCLFSKSCQVIPSMNFKSKTAVHA